MGMWIFASFLAVVERRPQQGIELPLPPLVVGPDPTIASSRDQRISQIGRDSEVQLVVLHNPNLI